MNNPRNLHDKLVVVVGAGGSGCAAARLALRKGARVILNDLDEKPAAGIPEGAKTHFGGHPAGLFRSADLIVLSPGVPPLPVVREAAGQGVEVISEVELALRHIQSDIAAVTGTNGKSTTVSLLGAAMETTGRPVFTGGNLGTPLSDVVDTPAGGPGGLVSLELSSFQLEHIHSLRPKVAALLNLTEDHLDRYDSFEHYWKTKLNVYQNHPPFVVFNEDDELVSRETRRFFDSVGSDKPEFFGFSVVHARCAFHMDGEHLAFPDFGLRIPSAELKITGRHMMANALAAIGSALLMGANAEKMREVATAFPGLKHRMEYCGEVHGVRYYNDSKATNVGSVIGSLSGWETPYVLLLGGRHKGAPYEPLAHVLRRNCRAVVALGESAELIRDDLSAHLPVHMATSFDHAMELAAGLAVSGDSVILSPACSSYDMFENYRKRGERFRELVEEMP